MGQFTFEVEMKAAIAGVPTLYRIQITATGKNIKDFEFLGLHTLLE